MIGDTGTHSIIRMPTDSSISNVSVQVTTEPVKFYTVYNRTTDECVGDDFTIAGALDAVAQMNLEDGVDEWSYYANDHVQVLDSMVSLVQDHHSKINRLGGQG